MSRPAKKVKFMSTDATLDSMVYTPFQYVSPYTRHDWNIQAWVGQKIVINEHYASKKMKLLLIDSQGWKMEAMMYGGIVVQSGSQISEGKVYSFANVRVQGAPDIFRSTRHSLPEQLHPGPQRSHFHPCAVP